MEKHIHFWIIDSKGFARCRDCPATKQFPMDYPKIPAHELRFLENLDTRHDPGGWLKARVNTGENYG